MMISNDEQVTAMFAFGDSLIDNGNNNFLNSFAKANYIPYGIDFNGGIPSGRFTNGLTIIDYLGELLGLPLIPAFANPFKNIHKGVNYASAAAGILQLTGQNLGERFSLRQQVDNFRMTLTELRIQMNRQDLSKYLKKSIAVMILGSNDYLNNYLNPAFPSSKFYNPEAFANLLINRYTTHILTLHGHGLRKFLLAGVAPMGCIPSQLAVSATGKCSKYVNNVVEMFNRRLKSLVIRLNTEFPESIFVYGDTFAAFSELIQNSTKYGLNVADKGCCGVGRNKGQISCLPFFRPCRNRDEYVFWDAFHPTQAANRIIAQRAYNNNNGTSFNYCYPINVKQMAHL
ncbi:GDSL esterase/lipase At5g08460-like [Impatiens glandulifera]|uniref:GDSL esterase/lipase At5g08460-like n=1 Tax=Impatiens glandulifera TaxID=253017 RepID=UPI001FB14619|nr:GDSL esterase/lipase At5g08460-like [Impatiens glandulifera]